MLNLICTLGFLSEEDIYPTHMLSVVWPHNTSAVIKGVLKNHKIRMVSREHKETITYK